MIAKYKIGTFVFSTLVMVAAAWAWVRLGGPVHPLFTPEYIVGWFTGLGTGWFWRSGT